MEAAGSGRDRRSIRDHIILTNEDPYDENPQQVIDQIADGIDKISVNQRLSQSQLAVHKIIDRREAINKALSLAKAGDTVIITGKGCEPSICLAHGQRIPWDDRQTTREEFSRLEKIPATAYKKHSI